MIKPTTITLLFFVLSTIVANAQPFAIGETDITFTDPARNGRSIPTAIYYPAQTSGTNTTAAPGAHCTVVFGHGFLISYTQYQWLANALVPQGYILAFPDTETGFPNHGDFGLDLAFLVTEIQNEGSNPSSLLFGVVGTKTAIGGHSMGGGASFLGADGNSNIDALFNFAAAETNPSAIAAAANVLVPTLVIEGTDDCVTPSAGNTGDMYAALNTSCQSLISITGASHCQFANNDFVCTLGQLTCGGSISQTDQETTTLLYLEPFLDYYLKGDCSKASVFNNLISNPVGATIQSNCALSQGPTISGGLVSDESCLGFDGSILGLTATGPVSSAIWTDINGTTIGNSFDIMGLTAGIYTLTVEDLNGCTLATNYTISTSSGPNVTISNVPGIILNSTPVTLSGTPAGGVFTGVGVFFNAFNPAISGPGNFSVIYTYTDMNGCVGTDQVDILVGTITYNFVNYNLGTISPRKQTKPTTN